MILILLRCCLKLNEWKLFSIQLSISAVELEPSVMLVKISFNWVYAMNYYKLKEGYGECNLHWKNFFFPSSLKVKDRGSRRYLLRNVLLECINT